MNSFEPEALRDHISMYFQEPNACRCGGAAPDGIDDDDRDLHMFGKAAYRRHLAWWMGEGQGSCSLVEILDDTAPPVPEFEGRVLLHKTRPTPRPLGEPVASGRGEEVLAQPLFEMLASADAYGAKSLGEKAAGRDVDAVLHGFMFGPHGVNSFGDLDTLYRNREWRAVAAVVHARAPYQTAGRACDDLMAASNAWIELQCYDDGLAAARRMLELVQDGAETQYPLSNVLNQVAWAAYRAGDFALAVEHARQALADDDENLAAKATLATALTGNGQEDEGFALLDEVMKQGLDPEPRAELEQDSRYRDLARQHAIPVFAET